MKQGERVWEGELLADGDRRWFYGAGYVFHECEPGSGKRVDTVADRECCRICWARIPVSLRRVATMMQLPSASALKV